jgi:hypothetical protein
MSFYTGTVKELLYSNVLVGVNKNTFTSEVTINDTATMGVQAMVPAKYWQPNNAQSVGKGVGVIARGILSSTGTPTFTPTIRLGASQATTGPIVLGSSVGLTTISGAANQMFEIVGEVFMTAIGPAGANSSVRGIGRILCGGLASPFFYPLYAGAASPGLIANLDWSIDNFVNVNFACSVSNAANAVQLQQLEVYGLN